MWLNNLQLLLGWRACFFVIHANSYKLNSKQCAWTVLRIQIHSFPSRNVSEAHYPFQKLRYSYTERLHPAWDDLPSLFLFGRFVFSSSDVARWPIESQWEQKSLHRKCKCIWRNVSCTSSGISVVEKLGSPRWTGSTTRLSYLSSRLLIERREIMNNSTYQE